ncbi:tyrosine-type recombinase/integrase [Arachidicoccus soli]|uniref:Integrase n=1 Tax=Arachidicoccus soli TaxID=2341117 RepID=A0A386HLI7_9BACT|nr:tyrosine-type recombinase/integrase [Arachidicoccus soli]AYD46645.1 integrase [Arachidicoccus soli]
MGNTSSYLQSFFDYLQFEKRYSKHTIIAYKTDLLQFVDYLFVQYPDTKVEVVEPFMVRSWMAALKEKNEAGNKSIHRKASSLKSFYRFLLKESVIIRSPLATLVLPKLNKRLPSFLKEEEAFELISEKRIEGIIDEKDFWEQRTNHLIVKLFYESGIRLSELINLKENQIDESYCQIRVLGKGNKERIVPISKDLLTDMQLYLTEKSNRLEGVDNFFVMKNGKALYPKKVYNAVKKLLSEVTSMQKKSPHILRHSFATHLMNHGADLNAVKELLGHTSLAATQVYTHNTIEKLKDIHKKAHPKA